MKKIKKFKVGTDSETYAISMVEEPAIEVNYVALAKQEEMDIKLSSDERHICYGPALIPNKDIYRNNGEQEFYINFTEESIVKMSQDFMKNFRQKEVNLEHEEDVDEVYVCESWLVEDPYKDKANALGFNVPKNTWMIGMKVNNVDTWEKVKAGELKGFSVESAIRLEEFSKQTDNNMINTDEMSFWTKMKEVLAEAFSKKESAEIEELAANSGFSSVEDYKKEVEAIKEELAEETPAEPVAEPTPAPEPTPEPAPEEPKEEPTPEPKVEEPKAEEPKPQPQDNHLEELINNLKDEIAALKEMNTGLQEKIKDLSKEPSVPPVNVNAKPSAGDTYSAWREKMRNYIG